MSATRRARAKIQGAISLDRHNDDDQQRLESSSNMASTNKAGYEKVPDVEARLIPVPKADPRETYPEADELQARLLGELDELIKLPNPKVELPRIQAEQVSGAPTTWRKLVEAVKIPTLTFIASIVAAAATIVWGSPLVQMIYPYAVSIAAFASSIPALTGRFTEQSDKAFETLDKADSTIDAQVDAVTFKVNCCVDSIQDLVKKVLEPVRPKLEKAKKVETILQKYDDTIDIPDSDDIEKELDGCGDAIEEKMDAVKRLIDFRKYVPVFLRSKDNFSMYMIYPVLAVFLALQLYGVYQTSQMQTDEATTETASASELTRFLRGSVLKEDLDTMVEEARSSTTGEPSEEVSWYPMWVSLQVYLSAVAEILIGFLMSQAAVIAAVLNVTIGRVEKGANEAIDTTGATDVFNEFLTTKMEVLRAKLLKLVQNMIKIDKAQEKITGAASAVDDLADSAKETIEKVKEQKRLSLSLPWSPFGKK